MTCLPAVPHTLIPVSLGLEPTPCLLLQHSVLPAASLSPSEGSDCPILNMSSSSCWSSVPSTPVWELLVLFGVNLRVVGVAPGPHDLASCLPFPAPSPLPSPPPPLPSGLSYSGLPTAAGCASMVGPQPLHLFALSRILSPRCPYGLFPHLIWSLLRCHLPSEVTLNWKPHHLLCSIFLLGSYLHLTVCFASLFLTVSS